MAAQTLGPQRTARPIVRPGIGTGAWRPSSTPPKPAKPIPYSGGAALAPPPVAHAPAAPAAPRAPAAPAAPAAPRAPAAPAAPDLSGNNWQAYLTPDQLGALRQAGTNAASSLDSQQRRIEDAQASYTQQVGNAQFQHDTAQAQANEQLAARGLFLSSVRDNDMTDINRTLAQTQASATANLNSLIADATAAIGQLQSGLGITTGMYQGLAGSQALAQVQQPAPAAPAPAARPVAAPAARPAAPAPKPTPRPAAAPIAKAPQKQSSRPAPARPGAKSPAPASHRSGGVGF